MRAEEDDGFLACLMKVYETPITVIRDYTCPMSESEQWCRTKASVAPTFVFLAAFYLNGNFADADSY